MVPITEAREQPNGTYFGENRIHGKAFHILRLMHETNVDLDIPKFDRNSSV